ncbi:hypothetical protein RJ640_023461 [Escallonia rubra]|uniref:Uncharacterized protein n=1 Tax=Escallonia rubra TaxID=112253 RepID=A0AA88RWG8_9ASTE|nr:hypothetical protein RJ640_023461 [Escallonia rubra]
MEMRDIATQLKSLEIGISETFLVQFILDSLPIEYGPFKFFYNTHKDKWSINELLTIGRGSFKHDGKQKHFFCKKKGHMKKECLKYKKWLGERGNIFSLVCYEFNLVNFHHNTCWIVSGASIHIANIMQGFLSLRQPIGGEQRIYLGKGIRSHVEAVGTFTCSLVSFKTLKTLFIFLRFWRI